MTKFRNCCTCSSLVDPIGYKACVTLRHRLLSGLQMLDTMDSRAGCSPLIACILIVLYAQNAISSATSTNSESTGTLVHSFGAYDLYQANENQPDQTQGSKDSGKTAKLDTKAPMKMIEYAVCKTRRTGAGACSSKTLSCPVACVQKFYGLCYNFRWGRKGGYGTERVGAMEVDTVMGMPRAVEAIGVVAREETTVAVMEVEVGGTVADMGKAAGATAVDMEKATEVEVLVAGMAAVVEAMVAGTAAVVVEATVEAMTKVGAATVAAVLVEAIVKMRSSPLANRTAPTLAKPHV
ncbi:hypothetical protein KP509_01G083000 [Ceratopteris richardii]|uniref:Uncharacterized protein n=1 Tax=Ceratopteris richardii TaxID=49495 RepID=A0A8T2VI73_CERRI|nr:hypothetical protein KP509_01G083000 [Ceratopteris richardii]